MLADGHHVRASEVKKGMFLMGPRMGSQRIHPMVLKVEPGEDSLWQVILENGLSYRCTSSHLCVILGHKAVPITEIQVGDGMYCYHDKHSDNISGVESVHALKAMNMPVIKITTTVPKEFYCNDILTHNMKVGNQQ